jgi:hypothetical protein
MMTHPLTAEAFAALGGPDLVYVRPVRAQDILSALPPGARYEAPLLPDQVLYALHSADGARLAVLVDRDSAYAAARAHELAPVSVH